MFFMAPSLPDGPLGILGGTFDPVHQAHLRLAAEAQARLGLVGVWWLPAGQPRHRPPPAVSALQRLAMVRLAVAGHPTFRVDDTEVQSPSASYTVPTLERLRSELGRERPLVLLLGADAFLGLESWHRWHELLDLAHIAVASRPGFALTTEAMGKELAAVFRQGQTSQVGDLARSPAGRILTYTLSAGSVSSTEVRARLRAGQAVDELLPPAVLEYIQQHHLYLN